MTPTVLPTPGWLARTGSGRQEALLSLLAAGLFVAADDGDPETFYTEVAASSPLDVREILLGVFDDQTAVYPYLAGATDPLTDWWRGTSPVQLAGAARLAAVLADVDLTATDRQVGGDLLGRVYDELMAINRRMQKTLSVYPLPLMILAAVRDIETVDAHARNGKGWLDGACLSGVRSLGMLLALRACTDVDTDTITIGLRDPDPTWVAIAAINFAIVKFKGDLKPSVGQALVGASLYPDRFSIKSIDEAVGESVATPPGWDCLDWEIAAGKARDRHELVDWATGALAVEDWVHAHRQLLTGHTLNDLMAGLAEAEGGIVDDTQIDYGPTRATRPRVKRKKRVRGRR